MCRESALLPLCVALAVAAAACLPSSEPRRIFLGDGSGQPCTDYKTCCTPEELVCEGNIDDAVVCTCDALWSCNAHLDECERKLPKPPGGGDWSCGWSELVYSCSRKGTADEPPPGGNGWDCRWNGAESRWVCERPPPNPPNNPSDSSWRCVVVAAQNKLRCEKLKQLQVPPVAVPKTPDAGVTDLGAVGPPGGASWSCTTNADGKKVCVTDEGLPGGPGGGGSWSCHLTEGGLWICVGESVPAGSPPGGNGWSCKEETKSGKKLWVCKRPEIPNHDTPPGGGNWACQKGSDVGGTRCEEVPRPPSPPGFAPTPGETCVPGTKRWCDGRVYCGWGQMTCKPNGAWPTTLINGQLLYDCKELSSGARPNTLCACYHFFFAGSCCERPDCIVPQGSQPQLCPDSPGQLCDYCNPQKPECKSGALCVVNNRGEAFCGRSCGAATPCPSGYDCQALSTKPGTSYQCVPSDVSCYF